MVDLPPEFRTTPFSYYVWSRSRRAGHVLAFALAKFVDPSFRWMTIREFGDGTLGRGDLGATASCLKPGFFPIHGRRVRDRTPNPEETFESMIRPEGTGAERTALDHFFLLPTRLQRILDEVHAPRGLRSSSVANTNRIRQFYPADPERLRASTDVFPRNGSPMITTSIPPPYEGRHGFNIVLRLDVDSTEEWRMAHLVVEKGLLSGDLRTGALFTSAELPWYFEAGAAIEKAVG